MKREIRNPKSHRHSQANAERTLQVLETYRGKIDLLRTWEDERLTPMAMQIEHHDYIIQMRATVRKFKNLLEHRAYDPTV